MKCCGKEYPKPDIINGTAYFVCPECGEIREIENYRTYTPQESIEAYELEYGFKVPEQYIDFAGTDSPHVVKLPSCLPGKSDMYFGEGFYSIGTYRGLDPNEGSSIFDSSWLIREWELPKELVLIEGDGHEWLALDYRESTSDPRVIVIESEGSTYKVLANDFQSFIELLIEYEKVYDVDGNFIYQEELT